ncbi:Spx/MgsR family RNA polymerase-binding regulatory protein [Ureaplasma sp. ES3154-GEN]|uniref:Spx/MgsR family RNA polymerase-binding regulatory protein n=1 Tax=Ureaplasma sp. ES3154-GEN TaxID=2984844 RepID=UPI0021E72C90|nr:Spx/MgsR family RNA polymerase-binding regulatory protein [Ureaplasma sp. ES3154-GEN]MCV3743766.1 Spx/MgsR family RNA polymerase-binding regulatory protein [Ureaplasma sp. ES3154-GEN]
MIFVLYSSNSRSCKRVISFFRAHQIHFNRILLGKDKVPIQLIKDILELTFDGYEEIFSFKTQAFAKLNISKEEFSEMHTNDVLELLSRDSELLKRPIIFQYDKFNKPLRLMVGYDSEEIQIFLRSE